MEKIFSYITKNFITVIGITILTGTTLTTSALGVMKVANNFEKQIQFTIEIPHSFVLPIPPEYAKVVFSNLISNAIKFSPHSSSIEIVGNPVKKRVSVVDHGVGLSDEEKGQMFDRFYRSKEIRNKIKGYGLGLSLVREICKEYGIKISVESIKGSGTTMTLSF